MATIVIGVLCLLILGLDMFDLVWRAFCCCRIAIDTGILVINLLNVSVLSISLLLCLVTHFMEISFIFTEMLGNLVSCITPHSFGLTYKPYKQS